MIFIGFREILERRKIELAGLLSLLVVTVLNQIARTPLIYIFTVIGLIATVYVSKKFKAQFNVKLFFKRTEGWNWWSGAFAGVLAFMMSTYAQTIEAGFPQAMAEISAITVFVTLMTTLLYGSILQDIQKEEIEL
ncbi:hypothetical protein [Candidatus Nanohalovita haloferacivicina]|uniref:hypothetical protein n=1 Tax=Candidatus Nanohalovita haloferacivicina TaxID=2978046 RepID=UPI00325FC42F|nr:hypothetical protein HBNXNv_0369 [Candidatus Nanohalobia archaeon BNXNv]